MGLEHTFATKHVTMQALHKRGNPIRFKVSFKDKLTKIKAFNQTFRQIIWFKLCFLGQTSRALSQQNLLWQVLSKTCLFTSRNHVSRKRNVKKHKPREAFVFHSRQNKRKKQLRKLTWGEAAKLAPLSCVCIYFDSSNSDWHPKSPPLWLKRHLWSPNWASNLTFLLLAQMLS